MSRNRVSLVAALVFGFGAASLVGGVAQASAEAAYLGAEREEAVELAAGGAKEPGRIGEMDDEEKERRREVCERAREACDDWCRRTKAGGKCLHECFQKEVECLKKIPSNPIPPGDW